MTVNIYGWIGTLLAMGYLVCLVCSKDNQTVCHRVVSNLESRLIPYQNNYTETCWLFFTCVRSHTKYINESYTSYRLEKKCCHGFKNKNGTCKYLRPMKRTNADCKEPFTCNCKNDPGECLHTCKNCHQGKQKQCDKEFPVEKNSSCSLICPKVCVEKLCRKTKKCKCADGYVSNDNGTACLPECKQGCVHGICKSTNNCKCYCGWEGPSCEEAQVCLVASPLPVPNRFMNNSAVLSKTCKGHRSYAKKTLPACHQTCPEELRSQASHFFKPSETNGLTYYAIPIYTNCSTTEPTIETFLDKHNNLIAGVVVGVLASLAITGVFCTANIVKQKRRTKSMPSDKIVQSTSYEFMEENSIYVAATTDN